MSFPTRPSSSTRRESLGELVLVVAVVEPHRVPDTDKSVGVESGETAHLPPRRGEYRRRRGGGIILLRASCAGPHLGPTIGAGGDDDVTDDESEVAFGALDARKGRRGWRRWRWRRLDGAGTGSGGISTHFRRRAARRFAHDIHGPAIWAGKTPWSRDLELGPAGTATHHHSSSPPSGSTISPTAPMRYR